MNTQEKTPYQNEIDVLTQETEAKLKDLHAKYPLEEELKVDFFAEGDTDFEEDTETEKDAAKKLVKMLTPIFKNVSNNLSELNFSLKFHQSNTPDFGAALLEMIK